MGDKEALERIEKAEEELKLAKLAIKGDDGTKDAINTARAMLGNMCITDRSYTITSSTTNEVHIELKEHMTIMSKHVYAGWYMNCRRECSKMIVVFRRKDTYGTLAS